MTLSSVKTYYKGVQFICDLFRQVFTNLFFIVLSQGFTFFQPIIFWDGKKFLHVYRLIKAFSVDGARFRDVANRSRISHVFIVTTLQDPLKDTAILTKSYQQTKYSAYWWAAGEWAGLMSILGLPQGRRGISVLGNTRGWIGFSSIGEGKFEDIVSSLKERPGSIRNFVKLRTATTGMSQGFTAFSNPLTKLPVN